MESDVSNFEIKVDWESGEGISTPELQATMASVSIMIAGKSVTRVFDKEWRSTRDCIYIPTYPIAEWIAANWFPMRHECKVNGRHGFRARHLLSLGREGYAFPRLSISSEGDYALLAWEAHEVPYADLEFLNSGEHRIKWQLVEAEMRRFIYTTGSRLKQMLPDHPTFLDEEWDRVRNLDSDELKFCQVSGALGIDPFSAESEVSSKIIHCSELLPDTILQDFFIATNLRSLENDLAWVNEALSMQVSGIPTAQFTPFRERIVRSLEGVPTQFPWERGYLSAREVRRELSLDGMPISESILNDLGWREKGVVSLDSLSLMAITSNTEDGQVARTVVSERGDKATRFAFARALYESLVETRLPKLVTQASTTDQKASRAFAAEFLAPSLSLQGRIEGDSVTSEEIERLANEFEVSTMVIAHQIENHKLASILPDS